MSKNQISKQVSDQMMKRAIEKLSKNINKPHVSKMRVISEKLILGNPSLKNVEYLHLAFL